MNKNISCIYMIENKINKKIYIGFSVNLKRRWSEHLSELKRNKHENKYLQNSYNKYGLKSFQLKILEICSKEKLIEREIYYIKKYKSTDKKFGYNMTTGGDGTPGLKRTKKWAKNISKAKKGKPLTSEHCEALSKAHLGYIPTKEQKKKLQISNLGKKKGKNPSSKYIGVCKRSSESLYTSYISLNHKYICIGKFEKEKDAAIARDEYVINNNIQSLLNFKWRKYAKTNISSKNYFGRKNKTNKPEEYNINAKIFKRKNDKNK